MNNIFKQTTFNYLFLITLCLAIVGCSKEDSEFLPQIEDSELVLESFIFEKENNPHLNEDVVFNINENTVSGELHKYFYKAIPTFTTNAKIVTINDAAQTSASSIVDFRKDIIYSLVSESGATKTYQINLSWDDELAHIYIDTEGSANIDSKYDYLNAKLTIDGKGKYEDRVFEFSEKARIKGRGNTTWAWPKKPYKIKLDSKETLVSAKDPLTRLLPEKDWVLLADYQDGVHLLNNVAFTIGRMLEMPFTNTIIPVEVTVNGNYLGVYGLTEQVEIKTNRVNVGDKGILLELDQYFDEDWQFRSANYNLPVMVKDAEIENQADLDLVKNDWNNFESLVANNNFPNNNYLEYIDGASIAKYFIVYMLTSNQELNHPKSTYIHKTEGGKYTMGPIWDFDWAYGYEGVERHFSNPTESLFWDGNKSGTIFFKRFLTDPKIKSLLKEHWSNFTANHLNDLMNHIDEHSFIIEGAKARNLNMWNRGLVTDEKVMKQWLNNRVTYMNAYIGGL
ncbi:CotH kinase family protein [Polaribacter ponticola]|uniref:CotH kinase family protein n=1 Tax=Polaribacter ponticola TaxID=2978475 RepID=A0ABT5SD36_9FLAO|nr:CotH kinase family protein [Polaribacter sp. MSW5]MDD7915346.1 CotH kinase family protein [Polaribacter sp. MSW5]